MRLSEYLAKNGITPDEFATKVGLHPATIYRVLAGSTIPKRQNLSKIIEATAGQVDVSDLMFAVSESLKPETKETA